MREDPNTRPHQLRGPLDIVVNTHVQIDAERWHPGAGTHHVADLLDAPGHPVDIGAQ